MDGPRCVGPDADAARCVLVVGCKVRDTPPERSSQVLQPAVWHAI